ncbi:hypothetical protein EON66_07390, partial [archaeon]
VVYPDDAEVLGDEADDEFALFYRSEKPTKIMITTGCHPSGKIYRMVAEFMAILPNCVFYKRRMSPSHSSMCVAVSALHPCRRRRATSRRCCPLFHGHAHVYVVCTCVLVCVACAGVQATFRCAASATGQPSRSSHTSLCCLRRPRSPTGTRLHRMHHVAVTKSNEYLVSRVWSACHTPHPPLACAASCTCSLLVCALPFGPTAAFRLSSSMLSCDVKGHGNATAHVPELILNNFVTRLGRRIGRFVGSLFPPVRFAAPNHAIMAALQAMCIHCAPACCSARACTLSCARTACHTLRIAESRV